MGTKSFLAQMSGSTAVLLQSVHGEQMLHKVNLFLLQLFGRFSTNFFDNVARKRQSAGDD